MIDSGRWKKLMLFCLSKAFHLQTAQFNKFSLKQVACKFFFVAYLVFGMELFATSLSAWKDLFLRFFFCLAYLVVNFILFPLRRFFAARVNEATGCLISAGNPELATTLRVLTDIR